MLVLAARRVTLRAVKLLSQPRGPPLTTLPTTRVCAPPLLHVRKASGSAGHPSQQQQPVVSDVKTSSSTVKVVWKGPGGDEDTYPNLWLRENCQCPACFHPTALSRRVSMRQLQADLTATSAAVCEDGTWLQVQWSDGHVGTYPAGWLHQRAFNPIRQQAIPHKLRLEKKTWDGTLAGKEPRASFPQLLEDDEALLSFLQTLEEVGLVVVTQVPTLPRQVHALSARVGPFRSTHYGEVFDVEDKLSPSNLAYTVGELDMHNDIVYSQLAPGIQLLHCLKQFPGEGGANLLVDAVHVANILRAAHPALFHALASTPVRYHDVGTEEGQAFHAIGVHSMFELDHKGDVQAVYFNQMVRDSFLEVTIEEAQRWYKALLTFRDLIYHPDNYIQYKMRPGDMLVFDNHRVLHGRRGFQAKAGNQRHLQGAYWNWDTASSRRRVLQEKLLQH